MYAILYAFMLWHSHWENRKLLVYCDNEAVVEAINKCSIRGSTITPLQTLLLLAALFNISISAVWIPTASNSVTDALSRHDFNRLANLGYQYNHHNIRNKEPHTPIAALRQKLLSFLQTVSPNQHGNHTTKQSLTTHSSQNLTDTIHSQRHSLQLLTGLPTSSNQSKSRQLKRTSEQSETTTSNINSQIQTSTILSLTESSKEANEYTANNQIENVSLSPKTSSSKWSPTCATASLTTTLPTSVLPFVSASQHFYEQANSRGINGILFHLLDSVYPANISPSTSNKDRPHCSSPHPKQTHTPKAQKYTYHP